MPWIGFMIGMSHYNWRMGSSNYYKAYLGVLISLILYNKIYARVAQYFILRSFELLTA